MQQRSESENPHPGDLLERRRARILEAALLCFARHGVAKTSVEDVAREARLSRSTVYYQFGAKDVLVAAVVQHEQQALYRALARELQGIADPEERLRAGMAFCLRYLRGHAVLRRVLDTEPEVVLPILTDASGAILAAARDALDPLFSPILDRGALTSDAIAEWLTRVVIAYLLIPSPSLDLDTEEGLRLATRLVWQGIGWATRAPASRKTQRPARRKREP